MTGPLLEFRSVTAGYGTREVVRDASFAVAPGEFLGIIGPNGAGKSTLVRAVTGGADIFAGEILCDGTPVERLSGRERARLVGVVPQSVLAPPGFSARAFVEMGRNPHLARLAMPDVADAAVVDDVMRRTDTGRLAAERVDELSGGDLQRLALAQALAQQPRVLLLDEPTSHLDLNHTLQVLELVRGLADDDLAVVGVFHDLNLAARYADRIAIVACGTMTRPDPPREALTAATVADVFGVRSIVRVDPVTGAVGVTPLMRDEDLQAATRAEGSSRRPVGLVCGSGSGAPLMRRLVRMGRPVEAGALNLGDVDQAVAAALGASRIDLPAFGEVDAAAEDRVRLAYAACAAIVVCPTPFGRSNVPNLRAAVDAGVPLLFAGEMTAERDFSAGVATALFAGAVSRGARVLSADDIDGVLAALKGYLPDDGPDVEE